MGIQGAGKSTFYARELIDTHIRINLDMIKTRNKEDVVFEGCLNASQSFVIDNTNTTCEERARYIERSRQKGFMVIGYFLRSNIHDCIIRNNKREGNKKIPATVIASRYNNLQLPSLSEGFHQIYYVSIIDGEFCIEEYKDDFAKDEERPKIVSRKLSIPVSDQIDWESIVYSIAWNKNLGIDLKEAPSTRRPLALLELVGNERDIIDFSKVVHEKINDAMSKVPLLDVVRGYFSMSRWSSKDQKYLKMATDMGLRMDLFKETKTTFTKTVFYEIEGRLSDIKEFVDKTNSKASS